MGTVGQPSCNTCKFWNRNGNEHEAGFCDPAQNDDWVEKKTGHKTCLRIIHGNENSNNRQKMLDTTEPAACIDGSGYSAVLVTRSSFYCALHEEQDK